MAFCNGCPSWAFANSWRLASEDEEVAKPHLFLKLVKSEENISDIIRFRKHTKNSTDDVPQYDSSVCVGAKKQYGRSGMRNMHCAQHISAFIVSDEKNYYQ